MRVFVLFIVGAFCLHVRVSAQSASLASHPVALQSQGEVKQMRHRAAWGISYAGGDPTLGRGNAMLSLLYGQRLSSLTELEASLHYLGHSDNLFSPPLGNIFQFASTTWTSDVSLMFAPFSGFAQSLRVGTGVSLRWHSRVSTALSIVNNATNAVALYSERLMLGGNLKLDYPIALSEHVDIMLRLQTHVLMLPFSGDNHFQAYRKYDGSASLGMFLSLKW
jgi:hypothetical protein